MTKEEILNIIQQDKNALEISDIQKLLDNKEEILNIIQQDKNALEISDIKKLLDKKIITEGNLGTINIKNEIIDKVKSYSTPILKHDSRTNSIDENFTEIYFWGIPGSSKTCSLAAILRTADKNGELSTFPGNGSGYLNQLTDLFEDEIVYLPDGTQGEVTQALRCKIREDENGTGNKTSKQKTKEHPIAFIEISGEIFNCFDNIYKGSKLKAEHQATFDNLENLLRDKKNKKIHFFIIDAKVELNPKIGEKKSSQKNYLQSAIQYFHQNNIFNDNTIGIYVFIAKCDLFIAVNAEEQKEKAKQTLLNGKYKGFVNYLELVCDERKINESNQLEYLLFSIGDVYFKRICEWKDEHSRNVIQLIKNITEVERKKLRFFEKIREFLNS